MAHKKGAGSSDNGRDSRSKRLGVKLFGGQAATAGNILVRQRGTKFHAGDNVYMGRDHTLHAKVDGTVVYTRKRNDRNYVSITPAVDEVSDAPKAKAKAVTSKKAPAKNPELEKTVVAPKKAASAAKAEAVEAAAPIAEVVETPVAEVIETPVAEVVETPVAEVIETPVAEVIETPVAEVVETPAAEVVETPAAEVIETPVAEVVETPTAPKKEAKTEAPVAEEKAAAPKKTKGPKLDDLKIIEGVGPKIETLLKEGGISTWEELAAASVDRLKEILEEAGPRYNIHDPSTWPAQSKFAAEGKFEELKEYQDVLTGGRDES